MSSTDNITLTEQSETTQQETTSQIPNYGNTQLTSIEIANEVIALNVMVSFLNIAQKRGAFALDESSKIWECIQKFITKKEE